MAKHLLKALTLMFSIGYLAVTIQAQETTEQVLPKTNQENQDKAESKKQVEEPPTETEDSDQEKDPKSQKPEPEDQEKESPKTDGESKKSGEEKSDQEDSDDKDSDGQSDEPEDQDEKQKQADQEKPKSRRSLGQSAYSKKSNTFVKVFDPVIASVNDSTIRIMSGDDEQIALGTVVDSGGLILTKASELEGEIGCELGGKIVKATVFGIDEATDLALLKVEAENLSEAPWSDSSSPMIGQWLATPKANKDQAVIGVVAAKSRLIPKSRAFIGIQMENFVEDEIALGVKIVLVMPSSPAKRAGLKVGDIIQRLDDFEITDRVSLVKAITENYNVDDYATLEVKRNDEVLKLNLQFAKQEDVGSQFERSNAQNSMGSTLSQRRNDFPEAFQHDSNLNQNTCGGPIVDLSGKIVGINIARAGRVSSLALPSNTIRLLVEKMKSGDLAPEKVNSDAIAQIDARLKDVETSFGNLPEKKDVLQQRYSVERARSEELKETIKSLQERLKLVEEREKAKRSELKDVKDKLYRLERTKRKLESEKNQLITGIK
ncbi:MAG: PDZ domain-containing protein [Planctomycetota bacterium]